MHDFVMEKENTYIILHACSSYVSCVHQQISNHRIAVIRVCLELVKPGISFLDNNSICTAGFKVFTNLSVPRWEIVTECQEHLLRSKYFGHRIDL